ncbi:MAG TPA: hypothetical protein VKD47_08620 [Miltoncostaeaceae bacterium]|nr:hypothetical protein [Miltoncostaeaceae bacterium]
MDRASRRRRGRWMIGAGVVAIALARQVARNRDELAAQALRLRSKVGDPVAPFTSAPCYAPDPDARRVPGEGAEVRR